MEFKSFFFNSTPLTLAIHKGLTEIVEELLNYKGTDVNLGNI